MRKAVLCIRKKRVGEGESVFIIAEAGVNHNGDLSFAKKLIDAAAQAGADAIKFQTVETIQKEGNTKLVVCTAPPIIPPLLPRLICGRCKRWKRSSPYSSVFPTIRKASLRRFFQSRLVRR